MKSIECVKGCCLDETLVTEEGENWIIKRKLGFKRLTEFTKGEPEYPDIMITPGVDPNDPTFIIPVDIVYPKKYGDLHSVLYVVIPNIMEKQEECKICMEAKKFFAEISKKSS